METNIVHIKKMSTYLEKQQKVLDKKQLAKCEKKQNYKQASDQLLDLVTKRIESLTSELADESILYCILTIKSKESKSTKKYASKDKCGNKLIGNSVYADCLAHISDYSDFANWFCSNRPNVKIKSGYYKGTTFYLDTIIERKTTFWLEKAYYVKSIGYRLRPFHPN